MITQTGLFNDENHQTTRKRVEFDYYPTPAGLTKSLIQNVPQLPQLCFEPCAGQGAISGVLRDSGRVVSESDIQWVDQAGIERSFRLRDATTSEFWESWAFDLKRMPSVDCRNWATVTNPPFSLASEILPLAYEHSPWGVAFLLGLNYLEPTGDRADWLKEHADNFRYLIPVNPRPKFRRDTSGTASMTVAWMVWIKNWSWRSLGIKCPFIFESGWK
jgi:hypothetical protein